MTNNSKYLPYKNTGYFSKLVLDYIEQDDKIKPFLQNPATLNGIKASIASRKDFSTDRKLLVEELHKQYEGIELSSLQHQNLTLLSSQNTFTVCTAHQPNIFTGHLYFIYKILHTIKLAQSLNTEMPQYNFVPVFYMGSEDADLDELGNISLNGEKLTWNTSQTGAVGRMLVDKELTNLVEQMRGQLGVYPHGEEIIQLFQSAYQTGTSIQQATLKLVNELFKVYGLLILIPDNARFKQAFNPVVKNELINKFSHPLVEETAEALGKYYKVQASGRVLNLFYLLDGKRERIVETDGIFKAAIYTWTKDEILSEVDEHPERFSANVILRGVFQETILPNIAFIGGGGEIAYWLELKNVFEACSVPYPVLIVRNSFLLIDENQLQQTHKLGFSLEELFKDDQQLVKMLVEENSNAKLKLSDELQELKRVYEHLKISAEKIDPTLAPHVNALHTAAAKKIEALQKKMFRAERKKFEAEQRQLHKLKQQLFPNNSLQERVDNFATYYAKYGKEWLQNVCDASLTLEQQFCILRVGEKIA